MTKKPEEIEGSSARAKDRGAPDGLEFLLGDAEKPSLGNPADVAEMVRDFASSAQSIRMRAITGALSQEAAVSELENLCRKHAAIAYGKDGGWRSAAFNSPEQLGRHIKSVMGLEAEDDEAAFALFMDTAGRLFAAHAAHQGETASDDEVQFQIETALEDAERMILGLPSDD